MVHYMCHGKNTQYIRQSDVQPCELPVSFKYILVAQIILVWRDT